MASNKKLHQKSNKVHRLYSTSELAELVHHYSKLSSVQRFQHYAALWELRMKFCPEEKFLQDRQKNCAIYRDITAISKNLKHDGLH